MFLSGKLNPSITFSTQRPCNGIATPPKKRSVPLRFDGGCTVLSIDASQSVLKKHALAALQYAFLRNRKVGVSSLLLSETPNENEIERASAAYDIARELVEWSDKFVVVGEDANDSESDDCGMNESVKDQKDIVDYGEDGKLHENDDCRMNEVKHQKCADDDDAKNQKFWTTGFDTKCQKQGNCDDTKYPKRWNEQPVDQPFEEDSEKLTFVDICFGPQLPEKKIFSINLPSPRYGGSGGGCPSFDFHDSSGSELNDLFLDDPPLPFQGDDLELASPLSSPFSDTGSNLSD